MPIALHIIGLLAGPFITVCAVKKEGAKPKLKDLMVGLATATTLTLLLIPFTTILSVEGSPSAVYGIA